MQGRGHAAARRATRYDQTMSALVRTLLIWMLALALPLQGAAAALMSFCDSNRRGAAEAGHQHAHGGEVYASAAQMSHHQALALTSQPSTGDQESLSSDATNAGSHKCSACASCCTVGALPDTVLTVPTPEIPVAFFTTPAPAVEAFAADGPDRPPRPVQV